MCRVLEVSPSGYYGWRSRHESARSVSNRQLLADIRRIHAEHHRHYGSPRVHAALRAEDRTASRGRMERLMRRQGILALAGHRFWLCTTDSRHDLPIAPNLLKQQFSAAQHDLVGRYHLPAHLQGLAPSGPRPRSRHAKNRRLVHARPHADRADIGRFDDGHPTAATEGGIICHSDRGSQYAAEASRKQLADMKATPSMSRTGCCYDNAPMESLFHTLKVELVHQRRWATRDEARRDLFAYIEGYYNPQRIHSALGYITPEQAERNAS